MKYLLILLSLHALATVKVEVSSGSRNFLSKFKTLEKAQAWIEDNKSNDSWGKGERWVRSDSLENTDACIEKRDIVNDIESHEECKLPKEYEITITDISEEVAQEEAAKQATKSERQEIRDMLENLHQYEKVGDWRAKVNKILRRLVKDNLKD